LNLRDGETKTTPPYLNQYNFDGESSITSSKKSMQPSVLQNLHVIGVGFKRKEWKARERERERERGKGVL
jgi:hypothetical protein